MPWTKEQKQAYMKTYRAEHSQEYSCRQGEYYLRHRETILEKSKAYQIKKRSGIDLAGFDALLLAQNGECKICKKPALGQSGSRGHIDHDHETGHIRGILCHPCNTGLGLFKDSEKVLLEAVAYLRNSKESTCG